MRQSRDLKEKWGKHREHFNYMASNKDFEDSISKHEINECNLSANRDDYCHCECSELLKSRQKLLFLRLAAQSAACAQQAGPNPSYLG